MNGGLLFWRWAFVWLGYMSAQTIYADSSYYRLQELYFLAAQSEAYLAPFEALLDSFIRQYGPLPSLQMYRYGALALKAKYASNLIEKKNYLFTAIASMDAQVARSPSDLEVRFIRGSFYYYLPFFLGKKQAAREDIQTIAHLLQTQPTALKTQFRIEVLRAMVEFLAQTGWLEASLIRTLRNQYT